MGCGEVWGGIGTAQLWGLRLQSSLGWLALPLLGILEGDRQRVVGSSVTLGVGEPQDLGLASISLSLAFALGHLICSWGYDYIHCLKGLLLTDTLSSGWNSLEALNSSQHWAAAP